MRWWLGLAGGALVSATVTIIMVIWEWLENPGVSRRRRKKIEFRDD